MVNELLNQELVNVACSNAKIAFREWSLITPPNRGKILFNVGKKIEEKRNEFITVLMDETGKTVTEADGEVTSAIEMAYYMAGEGRRMYGDTTHSELPNRLAITKRYPIGVCGIITPWNFPLSMMAWKVFPALICGNTVVLKPSRLTKKTAVLFYYVLIESGIPSNVINILNGDSNLGSTLIKYGKINMLSFTGSTETGRWIAEECGKRLIKTSLELGGKNVLIIMDDADLELAVSCSIKGGFSVGGQRCASTGLVLVHNDIYDNYINRLKVETKQLIKENKYNCMIDESNVCNVKEYMAIAQRYNCSIQCGGKVHLKENKYYCEPTIITDVVETCPLSQIEMFAPILPIIKVNILDEAIGIQNRLYYGLTSSIITKNINNAMIAIDRLKVGVCYVNAPTYGSEVHLPFGGVKESGNGYREVGKSAIDTFSELKTIYIDYSGELQNVQIKK